MGILKHFRGKPRDVQRDLLLKVEELWDDFDVFVVTLPTASGKTLISLDIAEWAAKDKKKNAVILDPNNMLLAQREAAIGTSLFTLKRKDQYRCHSFREELPLAEANCQICYDLHDYHCSKCDYITKVKQAHRMPYMACNYYTYMAHKLHRPVAIVDEAHQLVNAVREMHAKKIWCDEYEIPTTVQTYGKLLQWMEKHPKTLEGKDGNKFKLLRDEIESNKLQYILTRRMEPYRGKEKDCILLLPVDTSNLKQIFFHSKKVEKVVLLSATISDHEVKQLGLAGKRVIFLEAESPISVERRPIHYVPVCNMSYAYQPQSIPKIAETLVEILQTHKGKGLLHAPYSLAQKLFAAIQVLAPEERKRFVFHDQDNKGEVFQQWKESPVEEGKVLVGSGMYEGLDLIGEDYEFQVITKIPFPSLADPAIRWLAKENDTFYSWVTIRDVVQAAGRICRSPTDYGITYILDSTFGRLYAEREQLFPKYFKEALVKE